MCTLLRTCIWLTATVLVAEGLRPAGARPENPSKASRHQGGAYQNIFFNRQTRSNTEGAPCVSLPYLTELKERFVRFLDHNNDGQSTFDEVKNFIRRFKPDVKDVVVAAFIARRDSNGNGAVDLVPEYVHEMTVQDFTAEGAKEWFHLQDTNEDGVITEPELMNMALAVGMTPEEAMDTVQGYYMPVDQDKDGKLTLDEFNILYTP